MSALGERGTFDGQPAVIKKGETGRPERLDIFYGGLVVPDGLGHGHVVSNDGININYWRTPDNEGGQVRIDDLFSFERLSSHMF